MPRVHGLDMLNQFLQQIAEPFINPSWDFFFPPKYHVLLKYHSFFLNYYFYITHQLQSSSSSFLLHQIQPKLLRGILKTLQDLVPPYTHSYLHCFPMPSPMSTTSQLFLLLIRKYSAAGPFTPGNTICREKKLNQDVSIKMVMIFFFFNREGSQLFLASVSYQLQESNSITNRKPDCKSRLQSRPTVFKCQLYQLQNYTMTWGKLFCSLYLRLIIPKVEITTLLISLSYDEDCQFSK